MSLSLLVTVGVIFILSLVVIGYAFYQKTKIPCMTGMMIAMTLGMMAGLTAGVILSIFYAENLFVSTLLGMMVGMTAGFLAGLPVSIMAVLDGALSGLMGGMMGAMLGEMITLSYRDAIIKTMFVLFVGIIMILFYMMQQELTSGNGKRRFSLFHHPLVMVVVVGAFFLGYNQLGSTVIFSQEYQKYVPLQQHGLMNPGDQNLFIVSVFIEAKEYAFSPDMIKIPNGQPVTIILKNIGTQEHDLEIVGLNAKMLESNHNGHDDSSHGGMSGIHVHTKPGDSQKITFVPLQSGVYRMICTLPGHKKSGMEGFIEVI